ncbi:MAG TPA: M48 family metalloprotease [Candidatus Angelobacter sp.]
MIRLAHTFAFALLFSVLIQSTFSPAQQPSRTSPCAMPSFSTVVNDPNMFTEQQEEWLGEIIAPQIQKEFHVIADPESDYLEKLGQRILAQLPPTKIHYHFFIIDLPGNDSFGFAGGYIFISRRILALAQNEDELAGLLGHEIGHIITRQPAIDMTRVFHEVLGVNQIGDRQDLLDKWNRVLDTAAKATYKGDDRKRQQQEQLIADRIAIYAMTRAGYNPSRFADYFDRIAQTKGNKGGFWSDAFGHTTPDSKRLRELSRNSAPIPAECVSAAPADADPRFLKWQVEVISAKFAVAKEDIPGLIRKVTLRPPLRGELNSIRFSPDGKYLLAQDSSSIFVLSHEPMANLFRIDAPDSYPAEFTPDSQFIVFHDKELRVEKWSLASRQRVAMHELALSGECLQTNLSPTGDKLACLGNDLAVRLVDVNTSNILFTRPTFYTITYFEALLIRTLHELPTIEIHMVFSPDGRYFVAHHGENYLAFDLNAMNEIKLSGKIKQFMAYHFTFLSPDEIAGYDTRTRPLKTARVRFPSGETVEEMASLGIGELAAPSKGNYLLLVHAGDAPIALMDLAQKKVVLASKSLAFAVYDNEFAGETQGGEVGIYTISDRKLVSNLQLPDSPLGTSGAKGFSPDGKWLAVSGSSRGALWSLDTGERLFHTKRFEGTFFDQDQFIAKFSKADEEPPRVFRFNLASRSTENLYELDKEERPESETHEGHLRDEQFEQLLFSVIPQKSGDSYTGLVLEVHDVRTNKKLWERVFPQKVPEFFYARQGNTLSMVVADYDSIKAEAQQDAALNSKLVALGNDKAKKDSYVVRVLEGSTGKNLGAILVDSGNLSFKVRWAGASGDNVLVGDSNDRTLVYSLASGQQRGKVQGQPRAVSSSGDRMLVENGKGVVNLYETSSLQPVVHFTFPSPIVHAEFSGNGNTLLILTADQTVYEVQNPPKSQVANAN